MENKIPLGLLYPIQMGRGGHFESAYYNIDNERTKLLNLMKTIEGERYMQPDFGLGLHKYLFEFIDDLIVPRIKEEIVKKVSFWVPNIIIRDLEVDIESGVDKNNIYVKITFSLSNNSMIKDSLTFIF